MLIPPRAYIIPIAAALLIMAIGRARAADDQPAIDCKLIRALVKVETPAELERKAKEAGASKEQIAEARRCLPSSNR